MSYVDELRNRQNKRSLKDELVYCPSARVNMEICMIGFNPYGANGQFGLYRMMQKTFKMTETLPHSNECQYDTV